jgi:hypothetical protein
MIDILNDIYNHVLGKWTIIVLITLLSWLIGISIRRVIDRLIQNIGHRIGVDLPSIFSKAGGGMSSCGSSSQGSPLGPMPFPFLQSNSRY